MIHEAAYGLEQHGFRIEQKLTDDDGTIGYGLSRNGEKFVLVAKQYAYKGLASFIQQLVQRAADAGFQLVFYNGDDETFTVFDADYYAQYGAFSTGKSKTRDSRWLELPLEDGAELTKYLSGADSPSTLAGNNATLGGFA